MEKPISVRNGGIKLPIGFRFHPTDEELVVHYLKRKVYSFPLPASVIPELDVFHTNPWDLPGDLKEKRYFFSKRKGEVNKCSSHNIRTCSGHWKAIGKDKQIVAPGSKQAVGMKKSLAFYQGNRLPHGLKTRWVMHEYCLVASATTPNSSTLQKFMMQMEDWVVCRIYQKKRKAKKHGVKTDQHLNSSNKSRSTEVTRPRILDFISTDLLGPPQPQPQPQPQPSSSCSSEITEVSSNELDQEASSGYISFSSFSCMRSEN